MTIEQETPHNPVAQLFCDRFREGLSYVNWRPRGGEDWLLIHTNSGAGQYKTRLGAFMATEGMAVLYAPGDMQDYRTSPAADHWDLTWVHFRPRQNWDAWLQWPRHGIGLRYLCLNGNENYELFVAAMARMREFSRSNLPGSVDFASNALEEALLWAYVAASRLQKEASDDRVRQAADYLSAHLAEPFQMSHLAARCGLSVSRLSHLFKEEMGISPQQFLEHRRIQHACHLLRLTSLSITEVARHVGYEDPFYFSKRFHRRTGQSPLRFRRESDGSEITRSQ